MSQSLDRGLSIIALLERKKKATITEIAKELGVNKSTVSRLIETLRKYDMVQMDKQTKKYWLGFRILQLSEGIKKQLNVISIARLYLDTLANQLGESVHLCTYNNGMAYVVDQVVSSRVYNLQANVGMIEPLHASSVGKCLLAYSSFSTIERILPTLDFHPFTLKTITNTADLSAELARIRSQGYAVDNEEVSLGVRCIAAPIYNYRGNVRHCIGVSGPVAHITEEKVESYAAKLVNTGWQISSQLGYNPRPIG